jgi:predicted AlkP superfamily pyrophosphatase or phosphodiesterase
MKLHPSAIAPQYNGRCFADLPATFRYWLTGKGAPALAPDVLGDFDGQYDLVFSFFVDSLGWELFQMYADENPFLKRLAREGRVSKITSQFPSTTAAHLTCIHTGLPVGQSGVYEWQYYEPKLDAVITPLLFSFAGTMERDRLKPTRIDPGALYPGTNLYDTLTADGVSSLGFGWRSFTPSTFSSVVMRGATLRPFLPLTEGLLDAIARAQDAHNPTYLFFYYGEIDTMCHQHGPYSIEVRAQIETFAHAMERWFLPFAHKLNKRALLVLFADHGHMSVTPQNTRYLNTDAPYKRIVPLLRTSARGAVLVPGGSPRDAFLYVREQALDEAHALLSQALEDYADVVKIGELIQAGYFGPAPVSSTLRARLGNLVVLPHPHNCVWWYEKDRFVQKYLGHHGGLTATEMEIPLALMDLG